MTRKPWDHTRTSTERGYGWKWQKLRKRILDREPLCRPCLEQGWSTPATAVDHVLAKARGGTDDEANLRPICDACHEAKTRADKGQRPQRQVGEDGWFIE